MRLLPLRTVVAALVAAALSACSGEAPKPPDAGPVDAGSLVDAGPADAGPADAGPADAGPMDAGPEDAGPPDAGLPPTGELTYSALHYDYRFDLDTRAATSLVTLQVLTGGDCLHIPFRPTDLHDVTLGGQAPRTAAASNGTLEVCATTGFREGEQVDLSVSTTVAERTLSTSNVGYSVRNDRRSKPFSYMVSWIEGCDRFGPCDNRPSVFATYHFDVTHPVGTQVLCSGDVVAGATETTCDFNHAGGPTYSTFGFAASQSWSQSDLGTYDGVHLTLYHGPTDGILTALDHTNLGGFLHWMIGKFGPYPYGTELRYATGPTYWSGFEHPGSVLLNERLTSTPASYSDPLNHTAMHELAHMWAGDQTTIADTYDFAWKESMAEYLTFVYEDEVLGNGVSQATALAWKDFASQARYYPVPLEHPALFDCYTDAYGPGPMVFFRQLERRYGRPAVLAALQSVIGQGPRALSVEQLRAALEATTGADLSTYFDVWVRGTGAPAFLDGTVTVTAVSSGDLVKVALSSTDGAARSCALTVQLLGSGGQHLDVPIPAVPDGGQPPGVVVNPGFNVTDTVLDPYAECLIFAPGSHKAARTGVNPWHLAE